jgi:tyrosine-protein phosphatase YwqE
LLHILVYILLLSNQLIIGDYYKNTPAIINGQLSKLKDACISSGIDIELHAAAEYMLDDYFMNLLKNEPLLTIHDNLLLTELPYSVAPSNVEEMVFSIITAGYKPILAHPERYFYYHRDYEEYHRLKDLGFILQVNLLSITGYYGPQVAKAAKYILQNGMADLVGTDMHHTRHLEALSRSESFSVLQKYLQDKEYNRF